MVNVHIILLYKILVSLTCVFEKYFFFSRFVSRPRGCLLHTCVMAPDLSPFSTHHSGIKLESSVPHHCLVVHSEGLFKTENSCVEELHGDHGETEKRGIVASQGRANDARPAEAIQVTWGDGTSLLGLSHAQCLAGSDFL